jgi:hypothetical protein
MTIKPKQKWIRLYIFSVRFLGLEVGSKGSISTIQPKRLDSLGSFL